ncbi:MAG: DUF4199 domain-containing protein [Proteobacteria bacterium]|nr:DUF4199 domain-containing protein [Pseudomonadota bacterium]
MLRIALIYGCSAGGVLIATMCAIFIFRGPTGGHSLLAGYLLMLAALSLIFLGIKKYRDATLGGVIRYWTAAGVGMGIALAATVVYVIGWEIYLWATDYTFWEHYSKSAIAGKQAAGASPAELAKFTEEMAAMGQKYTQMWFRMMFTTFEILLVGTIVALVSAGLLRKTGFLPNRAAAA